MVTRDIGRAWLVQLVRSLLSSHKVPRSALHFIMLCFAYLCDIIFRLS